MTITVFIDGISRMFRKGLALAAEHVRITPNLAERAAERLTPAGHRASRGRPWLLPHQNKPCPCSSMYLVGARLNPFAASRSRSLTSFASSSRGLVIADDSPILQRLKLSYANNLTPPHLVDEVWTLAGEVAH